MTTFAEFVDKLLTAIMPHERRQLKQRLAAPGRFYGGDLTIHRTGHVNVETDDHGRVVAVWFRCQRLPFTQHPVNVLRANEMINSPVEVDIAGVEVIDRPVRQGADIVPMPRSLP